LDPRVKDKFASSLMHFVYGFIAKVRKVPSEFSVFFTISCAFSSDLFRLSMTRKQISLWLLQNQGTIALQYYRIEP